MLREADLTLNRLDEVLKSRGVLRVSARQTELKQSPAFETDTYESTKTHTLHDGGCYRYENIHGDHSLLSEQDSDLFYAITNGVPGESRLSVGDDWLFTHKGFADTNSGGSSVSYASELNQSVIHHRITHGDWEHHGSATEYPSNDRFHANNVPAKLNLSESMRSRTLRDSKAATCFIDKGLRLSWPCPERKYRDSLKTEFVSAEVLKGFSQSLSYKNNLTVILKARNGADYLLAGHRSQIFIFEFDKSSNSVQKEHCMALETNPNRTTMDDIRALTWPYCPHAINFIMTRPDWIEGLSVVACLDDGRVLIWNFESLLRRGRSARKDCDPAPSPIPADFSLRLGSSVWGADLTTAEDAQGNKHHILAASANDRRITLFYYDQSQNSFNKVETHSVSHNIPEVNFVRYKISGSSHSALLSCTTISGELIIFKFDFVISKPPASDLVTNQLSVEFKAPRVIRRTCLGSECWTCKPVHLKYFKNVQSLGAMMGDNTLDEVDEVSRILSESKLVSLLPHFSASSDLGLARHWQFFETPVVSFAACDGNHEKDESKAKFSTLQEECRRLYLSITTFAEDEENAQEYGENDVMLAISTDKRLGLFKANTLFCVAATRAVFEFNFARAKQRELCNRILISAVIPELLSFIAVTQLGSVSIMRLCEYRGVFGMRQEHLIPNPKDVNIHEVEGRSIIGMTFRDVSLLMYMPRFILYLLYSDGLVLSYRLHN